MTADPRATRERWLLATLAGVQFSTILDFMLLLPLGAQLMRLFDVTPTQFGVLISTYMVTASAVGFAAAFLIDRFDRRAALLVLYACFALTTLLTATAQDYLWLLLARASAGAFGGVIAATVLAIVGDTIAEGRRGHALGIVMSAFSIASIAGIPLSLYLAAHWSWRTPFFCLTGLCVAILAAAARAVPRVHGHIEAARGRSALAQAHAVFTDRNHLRALGVTVLLNFSGFTVVPFVAPYLVANVGVEETDLAITYFCGGLAALAFTRLLGRLTDLHGRRRVFTVAAGVSIVAILITTHLPPAGLWVAAASQMLLFSAFSGRFVPGMAIVTGAVSPQLRGSFMSFNAALQQLSAGVASFVAAAIIAKGAHGELLRFGAVGWLSIAATLAAIVLAARVHPTRAAT